MDEPHAVEDVTLYGSRWTIYSDGTALESGTARMYPGGADELRAGILSHQMFACRRMFLEDKDLVWRLHPETLRLMLRSMAMNGSLPRDAVVPATPLRLFGLDTETSEDVAALTVELVARIAWSGVGRG